MSSPWRDPPSKSEHVETWSKKVRILEENHRGMNKEQLKRLGEISRRLDRGDRISIDQSIFVEKSVKDITS